jgi:hypothetical protein
MGAVGPDALDPLLSALTDAIASGSGVADRPGQLRVRLNRRLGAELAHQHRQRIHRVIVGAEEHLPARLTAGAPLSTATVQRLAAELARARGWSLPAAHETVVLWGRALRARAQTSAPNSSQDGVS